MSWSVYSVYLLHFLVILIFLHDKTVLFGVYVPTKDKSVQEKAKCLVNNLLK